MPDWTDTAPWLCASARFATTRWTAVLDAGYEGPQRAAALNRFCLVYWYPIYAFIRRRGQSAEDARDLTQGFFARLVEKDWLAGVERREARFSTLLLKMIERFLCNEYDRTQREKRGGGQGPLSIDLALAESWFGAEPATDETPRRTFERRWALAVLAAAHERLRAELIAANKTLHFEVLSPFLSREPEAGDYEAAGATLDMAARTVAVAVHRLRLRYRDALRAELASGSDDPKHVEEELRDLSRALS
jgi:DNA-directed RNA polymerase specialized sigma24 family protein